MKFPFAPVEDKHLTLFPVCLIGYPMRPEWDSHLIGNAKIVFFGKHIFNL